MKQINDEPTAHKVKVSYVHPPIPTRKFDWVAWFDGEEEGGPYGFGTTEVDAVKDLREQRGYETHHPDGPNDPPTMQASEFRSALHFTNLFGALTLPAKVQCGHACFTITKENQDAVALGVLMAAEWPEWEPEKGKLCRDCGTELPDWGEIDGPICEACEARQTYQDKPL